MGVSSARLLPERPPFIKRGKSFGRFAVGTRYERKVQEYLALLVLGRAELDLIPSPWIEFQDSSGRRWCQPDAVILERSGGIGVIYEVKYQHTEQAWWQLKCLYQPVLHVLFPETHFGLMELVHWHDPLIHFPEPYDLTSSPWRIPSASRIAVHIFNPARAGRFPPS